MLNQYVYKNQKKLRCGYTTGTCAAAAAKAAAWMLLTGECKKEVPVKLPSGVLLTLQVHDMQREAEAVRCAVQKDSGDDPDVTDGMRIYAAVQKCEQGIAIEGGEGVGRVTRKGLPCPVGMAAINPVPLLMIEKAVREAADACDYEGGLSVVISVPGGAEIAKKTFNPQLGIEGGISILGTSGIVEPMSEQALLDTIRTQMQMHRADGREWLLVTPGNYGQDFLQGKLHISTEYSIKCSNFIGDTIDMGCEMKAKGMLFVGHIGKLAKLGAGVMNTHSRMADARMETLACCALLAGGSAALAKEILSCVTTDAALEYLKKSDMLESTMHRLMERIEQHLKYRAGGAMEIGAVVFSNEWGILGKTKQADMLLSQIQKEVSEW